MRLYLFDQAGDCFLRIAPPTGVDLDELAQRNGAVAHVLSELVIDIASARIVNGELTEVTPVPRVKDYRERRFLNYPAIGDQLDALFHAMARGDLPMVADFYQPIAAVKAAHPKE